MMMEIPGMSMMNNFVQRLVPLVFTAVSTTTAAELPQGSAARHEGVATCAASQCHGSAVPREGSNVLQNEYVTWTQNDPHSKAYEVLSSDLSNDIANRLGLSSARTAKICLDCHADNVPAGKRGERFQISDGVGCEACHGGAGSWLTTHYNVPAVTHQANIDAGLYPTDAPATRGELCLSCHLGTRDKFATHRIMAAGHPRLSFELDTFTELWRTAGRQPHYRVDADYRERKTDASHSYTWAVGVLLEARQRLGLIRESGFADAGMFPELGLYDCHACHRTMKTVQWRRLPRHGDAGPGVPFINDGTLVMTLAMVRAIAPEDADGLQAALTELHVSGSSSIESIRSAAANLDGILGKTQSRLSPGTIRNRGDAVLREILVSAAAGDFLDYVSAEQAFMAVQMLAIELNNTKLEAALDDLAKSLENDERYEPRRFAGLLEAGTRPE
jgi:Cytochrome c554 and c-prime